MKFNLVSDYQPTGDQPEAIRNLLKGILSSKEYQTLLGVTGSGKTFTAANIIQKLNRPTLVISHNKTLAAQLYSEFKQFFPNNLVEYFVSYYDYYQPEAYIPSTGTYIEKDLSINEEIEKLRLSTTSSLLSGRKDIIVVSSVSCIYGLGNPVEFNKGTIKITANESISIHTLLRKFIDGLYHRTDSDFKRGTFRIKGDTIDIFPSHSNFAYRIYFFGNKIEEIDIINPEDGQVISSVDTINISPANIFVASDKIVRSAIEKISFDLEYRLKELSKLGLEMERKRLKERVNFDIEMMKELGYCSGIENYSRYFDGREAGERPFCLLDYFPENFMTLVDESHVTIPQIKAMYGGDRSRKMNLVDHGFRLPAALDNRPLTLEEWEYLNNQTIFISATPSEYEINKSKNLVIQQIIRPTGLLDPKIEIRSSENQIEDLLNEIQFRSSNKERTLVITLTKRMAEELTKYLTKFSVRCTYIHSDIDTLDRIKILQDLRQGKFDVLIGINLLREGLDLPEVSLVAILDADKEGFLRSERSLTQISGRAARHINGSVIMYADRVTESMRKTLDTTSQRRKKQRKYNKTNNITPTAISKKKEYNLISDTLQEPREKGINYLESINLDEKELKKKIRETKKNMEQAAKNLDFIEAARFRDQLIALNGVKKD